MKNKTIFAFVVFIFFSTSILAGETKNELLFDCNKPSNNPVLCTACNIYHEARSESHAGMWLVALVTKNRVEGSLYPLTNAGPKVERDGFTDEFCRVVYEQRRDKRSRRWVPMFSWTLDGKHDRVYNADKWRVALELASKVVASHYSPSPSNKVVDITFGCQWYHRYDIHPYWRKDYFPTIRIGAHQCYSVNEDVYNKLLDEVLPVVSSWTIKDKDEEVVSLD